MTYSIFSAGVVRKAANEGRAFYLPCTLANLDSLIGKGKLYQPDVAIFKIRPHEVTREYSLGLSVEAIHTAIDQAKCVIAELDFSMPFTQGQTIVDSASIDYIVDDDDVKPCHVTAAPDFANLPAVERRIGSLIAEHFIRDGVTIQTGIGQIPDAVVGMIRSAGYKDLGIQTELYGDGLMLLQKEGIVTNRKKKQHLGYSTTSLVMGSQDLYEFVHMRAGIQLRPCAVTNAAEVIRRNAPFISINTSMGVDFFGNVWADFIDARRYYSGIGGQPDFVRALNDSDLRDGHHRGQERHGQRRVEDRQGPPAGGDPDRLVLRQRRHRQRVRDRRPSRPDRGGKGPGHRPHRPPEVSRRVRRRSMTIRCSRRPGASAPATRPAA